MVWLEVRVHAVRCEPMFPGLSGIARNLRAFPQVQMRTCGLCRWLPRSAGWLDEFRREVMAFPAGHYTDQIDAFSQALDRAFNRRGGEVGWKFVRGLY